jgi:hypothetical protein
MMDQFRALLAQHPDRIVVYAINGPHGPFAPIVSVMALFRGATSSARDWTKTTIEIGEIFDGDLVDLKNEIRREGYADDGWTQVSDRFVKIEQ